MGKDKYGLLSEVGIGSRAIALMEKAESSISGSLAQVEKTAEYNQFKVIHAMQQNMLSDSHFSSTTGYGYGDSGRAKIDSIYAEIFKAESAVVRHNIVAGTHAISIAMFGNLLPGDKLVSVTGSPYDTLKNVIGLEGRTRGSLAELGVEYGQVDLIGDGQVDFHGIKEAITANTRMVFVQRSPGYCWRRPLSINDIAEIIDYIKKIRNDIIILVDNCYGEFVEECEPSEIGADLVAGSLIKNPGGGIAAAGGYIAGKSEFVENAACKLTAPGLGGNVGPTLGQNRLMLQGLFMAPHVVAESLKGAILCAATMQMLGFKTNPEPGAKRSDIIQAVMLGTREALLAFCRGIQKGSPVDAFVTPEPWDMPGYGCPVIMAAGGFIQGSSIELSADGPVRPPYIAYMQGGMVYDAVKLALMKAVQFMSDEGAIMLS